VTRLQILRGYFKRKTRLYRSVIRNRLFIKKRRTKIMRDIYNDIERRRQERPKL
jgi:hypothetical protein